ncbi:LysR substrate-binding domain-containing protein [Pseudomonas sp. NA-150]|uniref:LysR substrate-binding domain-containing protein n=1 Tax=Pseudomonas sp. NA-150 TaxID=3367525 RepID=UPI0037CB31A8
MSLLPPLRSLQVFEAVGHCGGISQAAKLLGITVGAVSQQMRILEDALGLSLTHKDGQRVRLNSNGQRFHARCSSAFEELRLATAEVQRSKNPHNLYVSALPSLLSKWLAPLTYEWEKQSDTLSLYLDSTLVETLDDGVDFLISYGESLERGIHTLVLFQDCVVPACSPRLAEADINGPAALLQLPLITIDSRPKFDVPPSWEEWFTSTGAPIEQPITVLRSYSSSALAIQAAIDEQGVVLAHYSMIERDIAAGRLLIPYCHAIQLSSPYQLRWNPNTLDKPQCRDFHRWLVARGKEQQQRTDQLLALTQPFIK